MELPFENMTKEQIWRLLGSYVNYVATIMQEDFLDNAQEEYVSKWLSNSQVRLVMLAADIVGNESNEWARPQYRTHEHFGISEPDVECILDDGPGWWEVRPELDYGQDE